MKQIIKKLFIAFSFVFIFATTCLTTFAKNNVSNIDIYVAIHDDGSATITQKWTGTFNEGTEVYLPIEDRNLTVKNLKVWKDSIEYADANGWNVDWNFEQKKWRSGIHNTFSGVELCFGISEYGSNTYTFSYDINPLVRGYQDADGFNFQFVNSNMDTFPSNVHLQIKLDDGKVLSSENARIWGFGYDGAINFAEDGSVIAFSRNPLTYGNYMNITLKIFKGFVTPTVNIDGTFDNKILNTALEGSSYKEIIESNERNEIFNWFIFAIMLIPIVLPIFSAVLAIISSIRRRIELKKYYKEANYFRDKPNGGSIEKTYTLYKDFDIWKNKETNVIGAIIMRMINDGNLEVIQEKSYGLFGKEKIRTSLKIGTEPTDPLIKELYDIIIKAAGSDGILQEDELKKYAKKNYDDLTDYLNSIENKGHKALKNSDCYLKKKGNKLKHLTSIGKEELSEVYGLRKFLDEFTLISERSITEGVIWEDLIVYATLFGIAKKVLKELKKLYPEKLVEIEKLSDTYYVSDTYYRTLYYSSLNAQRAAVAREAARAATIAAKGFGGSVSFGGGGGFSGGGSGGGTR